MNQRGAHSRTPTECSLVDPKSTFAQTIIQRERTRSMTATSPPTPPTPRQGRGIRIHPGTIRWDRSHALRYLGPRTQRGWCPRPDRPEVVEVVARAVSKPFDLNEKKRQKKVTPSMKDEIWSWKELNHQHVAEVVGFCSIPDPYRQYMVQLSVVRAFCSGGTLVNYLRQHPDVDPWEKLREVADALAYLHSRGIAHRGLKPNNILVDGDGCVKLVDMALPGSPTPQDACCDVWVAPEFQSKAQDADEMTPADLFEASAAADVFALGIFIVYVITGALIRGADVRKAIESNTTTQFQRTKSSAQVLIERYFNATQLALITNMCAGDAKPRPSAQYAAESIRSFSCSNAHRRCDATSDAQELLKSFSSMRWLETLPPSFKKADAVKLMKKRIGTLLADFENNCGARAVPEGLINIFTRVRDRLDSLKQHHVHDHDRTVTDKCEHCLVRALVIRTYSELFFRLNDELDDLPLRSSAAGMDFHLDTALSDDHRYRRTYHQGESQVQTLLPAVENFWSRNDQSSATIDSAERRSELLAWCSFELRQPQLPRCSPELSKKISGIVDSIRKASSGKTATSHLPEWFIPSYEVCISITKLGYGSFGAAYEAAWNSCTVVVKAVHADTANHELQFNSFESDATEICPSRTTTSEASEEKSAATKREADLWSRLRNPFIVQLFGACHLHQRFFVCEYAHLGSLPNYLHRRYFSIGASPRPEVWRLLHQAALALHFLHRQHIAHLDLRGDNILVCRDGNVRLADFGLSYKASSPEAGEVAKGAYQWKAPECLPEPSKPPQPTKRNEKTSPPARRAIGSAFEVDVYSFAMCIIEAVTGKKPYDDCDVSMAEYRIRRGILPSCQDAFLANEWNLIKDMCCLAPTKRISMGVVVKRLKEITDTS